MSSIRTRLVASLCVAAGFSVAGAGPVGASLDAAPSTTVPAPPPTCTCPPATAAAPSSSPTTAAGAATTGAPTTVAGVATSVAATPGPAATELPANATLEQLQQAVLPILGPTTDMMGEFAIFGVTPPAGVPTPAGAVIEEFQFVPTDIDTDHRQYRGVLRLSSTQPAAELVSLYQTKLVEAGYTQTSDSVDNTDVGQQIRRLTYDIPGATDSISELTVTVIDHDVDALEIEWWEAIDASIGSAFASWTGLPLVDQAVGIEDALIGNYISGDRVNLETDYQVPIAFAGFEQQLVAGLAGTPYTVDAEMSEPGSYVVLEGGPFVDLTVHFLQSSLDPAITIVNVRAQYEL